MSFADMDKGKKIKIGVAALGLLVGAVLVVNFLTDDKIKNAVIPPQKPEAPKLDEPAKKAYSRQKEQQKEAVDSGAATTAGG